MISRRRPTRRVREARGRRPARTRAAPDDARRSTRRPSTAGITGGAKLVLTF